MMNPYLAYMQQLMQMMYPPPPRLQPPPVFGGGMATGARGFAPPPMAGGFGTFGAPDLPPPARRAPSPGWDEVIIDGDDRIYLEDEAPMPDYPPAPRRMAPRSMGPSMGVMPDDGYGMPALPAQPRMRPRPGMRPRPRPVAPLDPNDPRLGTPMPPEMPAPDVPSIDTGYIAGDTRRKNDRRNKRRRRAGKPPLSSGGYQHPTGGRRR